MALKCFFTTDNSLSVVLAASHLVLFVRLGDGQLLLAAGVAASLRPSLRTPAVDLQRKQANIKSHRKHFLLRSCKLANDPINCEAHPISKHKRKKQNKS